MFIAKYTQFGSETYQNATKSAIAVGYAPASAHISGSRLIRDAYISEQISSRANKQYADIDVSAERVIRALGNLAFFDVRKFWNDDGTLRNVTELDADTAQALAGFEVERLFAHFAKGKAQETGTTSKIKLVNRLQALEALGRHHKLFTDKVEVSASEDLVQKIMEGRKRMRGEHVKK